GLLDGYTDEKVHLETQIQEKADLLRHLEQELHHTSSRLQELEEERQQLQQERELLSRQQEAMKKDAGPIELQLLGETEKLMKEKIEVQRQADKEHCDLQAQLKSMEVEMEEQVSRTIEMEQEKSAEIADLRQQLQALEKQLEKNRKFMDVSSGKITSYEHCKQDRRPVPTQMFKPQLQTERDALDRKEKEISNLEEQLEQFREELENKSEEVQQLHMQLEIQRKESSTHQQELEQENKSLKNEVENLRQSVQESGDVSIEDHRIVIGKFSQVLQDKDREIEQLHEEIAKLQQQLDIASDNKVIEEKNEQIKELETQIECLKSDQERLKRSNEEEVEQLNEVIEKLQQELANMDQKEPMDSMAVSEDAESLKHQLEIVMAEKKDLQLQVEKSGEEMGLTKEELKEQLQGATSRFQQTSSQLKDGYTSGKFLLCYGFENFISKTFQKSSLTFYEYLLKIYFEKARVPNGLEFTILSLCNKDCNVLNHPQFKKAHFQDSSAIISSTVSSSSSTLEKVPDWRESTYKSQKAMKGKEGELLDQLNTERIKTAELKIAVIFLVNLESILLSNSNSSSASLKTSQRERPEECKFNNSIKCYLVFNQLTHFSITSCNETKRQDTIFLKLTKKKKDAIYADLKFTLEDQKQKILQLDKLLDQEKQNVVELKQSMDSQQALHEAQVSHEQSRISELQILLDTEKARAVELTSALEREKELCSQLQKSPPEAAKSGEELLKELQSQLDEKHGRIVELVSEMERYKLEAVQAKQQMEEDKVLHRRALHREQDSNRLVQGNVDELQQKLKDLSQQLEETQQQILKFQQEKERLQETIQDLQERETEERREAEKVISQLDPNGKKKKKKNGSSSSLIERLLRQNAELTGYVSRLTEEKNDLRNAVIKLEEERSLKQAEAELSKLRADVRSEALQRDLPGSDTENSNLKRIYGKYLRAESFRKALIYQKKYLLLLLGGFQECEQATLCLIARMGGHPSSTDLEVITHHSRGFTRFRSAVRVSIAISRKSCVDASAGSLACSHLQSYDPDRALTDYINRLESLQRRLGSVQSGKACLLY
uniref:Pericentrin/AKAP-450 centrosomal targeting domain-containing protein n=1 Tax=Latimeria chalumnae TaxID=7897 RepID=H3A7R2_LATCH